MGVWLAVQPVVADDELGFTLLWRALVPESLSSKLSTDFSSDSDFVVVTHHLS